MPMAATKMRLGRAKGEAKGFDLLLFKFKTCLTVVNGIRKDLAAWEILIRAVALICFQFWGFSNMTQFKSRSANNSVQRLDLDPNSEQGFVHQPKLRPV